MKRLLAGVVLASCALAVFAASMNDVRKRAQASLLVTGSIDINSDGTVKTYLLDKSDKLPPVVVSLLGENVPTWKFQPVTLNGVAKPARAKMSLRIVARPEDEKNTSISIAGAEFGDKDEPTTESINYKTRPAPRYPDLSKDAGVSGEVYLLARVDRQGNVENVTAEQVNLFVYASERDMKRYRGDLANAALNAVKHWTFTVPTTGEQVSDDHWVARIPVVFNLRPAGVVSTDPLYGQWQSYIPGPREIIPWYDQKNLVSDSPDALPDGGLGQPDRGPQLLTPLGGA